MTRVENAQSLEASERLDQREGLVEASRLWLESVCEAFAVEHEDALQVPVTLGLFEEVPQQREHLGGAEVCLEASDCLEGCPQIRSFFDSIPAVSLYVYVCDMG